MILWHKTIDHPPGFVEKLEKQIVSQHNSKSYFTTYSDSHVTNDPILDEEIETYIKDFYKNAVVEMMKDIGIHGALHYKMKNDAWWVQMYNSDTDSHGVHDHHGYGSFVSWVHVLKAVPGQKPFFFINSRAEKLYPLCQDTSHMFAFPSWALHGAEPIKNPGVNRIIVAGNVHFSKSKE